MAETSERIERKYALTKIAKGDYLLPSNDTRTIWRLSAYMDGPTWGVWKWTGEGAAADTGNWGDWEMLEGSLSSRAEAINVALRMTNA